MRHLLLILAVLASQLVAFAAIGESTLAAKGTAKVVWPVL